MNKFNLTVYDLTKALDPYYQENIELGVYEGPYKETRFYGMTIHQVFDTIDDFEWELGRENIRCKVEID